MKASAANLLAHELVGRLVDVAAAADPGLVGRTGIIVDETRNLLRLRIAGRIIAVPKQGTTFTIQLETGPVTVDGVSLLGRPEERVRRLR